MMMAALTALALSPRLSQDGHTITFGRNESINCKTGQSTFSQMRDVNELKRAYSTQIVAVTAKKYGWTKQQTKQVEGMTQAAYVRR